MFKEKEHLLTPEVSRLFDLVREKLATTGWQLTCVDEAKLVLQSAISNLAYCENSIVVQSRAEILRNWRYKDYWYFDGAPLSVQIACYVGLKAGLLIPPEDSAQFIESFFVFFDRQVDFKSALNLSETVGGWIFPGEPELFWETIQRLSNVPGDLCEIGSWLGRSTILLAAASSTLSPTKKLHIVDDWNFGGQPDIYPYLIADRRLKDEFDHNLRPWQSSIMVHPGEFQSIHNDLKISCTQGLSFVFHDAGHSQEDFRRDLPMIEELLNPGGILIIHDYISNHFGESRKVIDDWITQHKRFSLEKVVSSCAVIVSK